MPSEPVWLDAKLVTEINAQLVAGTGEPFFVRDRGLLESALARPLNHWSYGEDDLASPPRSSPARRLGSRRR